VLVGPTLVDCSVRLVYRAPVNEQVLRFDIIPPEVTGTRTGTANQPLVLTGTRLTEKNDRAGSCSLSKIAHKGEFGLLMLRPAAPSPGANASGAPAHHEPATARPMASFFPIE